MRASRQRKGRTEVRLSQHAAVPEPEPELDPEPEPPSQPQSGVTAGMAAAKSGRARSVSVARRANIAGVFTGAWAGGCGTAARWGFIRAGRDEVGGARVGCERGVMRREREVLRVSRWGAWADACSLGGDVGRAYRASMGRQRGREAVELDEVQRTSMARRAGTDAAGLGVWGDTFCPGSPVPGTDATHAPRKGC